MCGITGFFNIPEISNSKSIDSLFESISHRGPDLNKHFVEENSIYFLFSRLSIIDLSSAGDQPMISKSGNSIIIFNGEIYNHLEIRDKINKDLKISWNGHSDTETLLESIEYYGIDILNEIRGMYSICFYDRKKNQLILINDRFGEKPLYYSINEKNFFFSSDIKSFNYQKRKINPIALKYFFRDNCIKSPLSIWKNVNKIKPGEIINIQLDIENKIVKKVQHSNYWLSNNKKTKDISKDSLDKLTDKLDTILNEVISNQLIADVPVGCFLSGGVDSSLVTAIASKNSPNMKTFSIGFNDKRFDEAPFSEKIAEHLHTDHHSKYFTKEDAVEITKKIPFIYGEPYSDSSQLPTILLSNYASKYVKVSLTGDGGDELFGGYHRYNLIPSIWKTSKLIPLPFKILSNKFLRLLSPYSFKTLSFFLKIINKKYSDTLYLESKLEELSESLMSKNFLEMSISISNHLPLNYNPHVVKGNYPINENLKNEHYYDENNISESLMSYDVENYLPNDLLVKTDRASMHYGLEARMPFLDHIVFNFCRSLPLKYKINKSESKIILKNLLYRYVPKKLFERPKRGFVVPLANLVLDENIWIKTLLNEKKIIRQGILNYDLVKKEVESFIKGNYLNQYILWDIIMFQQWYDYNEDKIS